MNRCLVVLACRLVGDAEIVKEMSIACFFSNMHGKKILGCKISRRETQDAVLSKAGTFDGEQK